jgi:hypothetical protein
MARYIRNTTVLAKIENTYGTDAVPTGAANAILVSDVSINPIADNVARDLIRPFMGASEELIGNKHIELDMTVELQNGGTAGTAPSWGPLLRACGFAEAALLTPSRVEYTPVSTGFEGVSIYYYLDGVVYKALGCRGSVDFGLGIGERPTMKFKFVGVDGGIAAGTPSGVVYTGFKTPLAVTQSNVSQFLLGCTYAIGVLSGGIAHTSRGLEFSLGADVKYIPTLGGQSADIVNRNATGKLTLDLDAAAEVTMKTAIDANTLTSIGMVLGSVAGLKTCVFLPTCQRTNPKTEDVDGRAMMGMDLRLVPSAGNDEIRIIML